MRWLVPFFLLAIPAFSDTPPIADETLRMAALHAIFPGMRVSKAPHRVPHPKSDALAYKPSYQVRGAATNKIEECASQDVASLIVSPVRDVRFLLFPWTKGLVAVLQYNFEVASPALGCQSIGIIVQLSQEGGSWNIKDGYLLEPHRHSFLKSIRMFHLTANGTDELMVESDLGGAGYAAISLSVFDLTARPKPVLSTPLEISSFDIEYKQELDIPGTLQTHGESFCFTKTVTREKERMIIPPRVTKICYPQGTIEIEFENNMLDPLKK